MNLFWRYGRKIRKWDDRLLLWSVIFCVVVLTVSGAVAVIMTETYWSAVVRVFEWKLLNGVLLLVVWDIVLLTLTILLVRAQGGILESLQNRQALARMLIDNTWYETDLKSNSRGEQNIFYMPHLYYWRRRSITYFPRMYYQKKQGEIRITVKIDMGKYQEQLLHLEKKIETGLDCEIVSADYKRKWMHYVFSCDVAKNRIRVEQMDNQEAAGKLRLMKHILWDYEKYPHALIVGGTGSGKTYLLLALIEGLAAAGARLFVVDAKNADLSGLSVVLQDVYCQEEDIRDCIDRFYDLMQSRMREMRRQTDYAPGKNYRDYGMRANFLIFDEYVAFMEMLGKKEWEEPISVLKKIILLGRQAGFFVILGCQRPDAKYMPDGMRDQFGLRVALGKMEDGGYTMIFGNTDKSFVEKDKTKAGRGYVKLWNGVITEFYSPDVPDGYDFIDSIRNNLVCIPGGTAVAETPCGISRDSASAEHEPVAPAYEVQAGQRQGEV